MIQWHVGLRDAHDCREFMSGLEPRILDKVQITTDGHHCYKNAIGNHFTADKSDYAQCVKLYGDEAGAGKYSPGECTGVEVRVCWGNPDPARISTSYVERQNLTMRMGMRRYTRLANGFSKKMSNHAHMTAIFFTYYNFCRRHQSLGGKTPAQAAGLASNNWTVEKLVSLLG
jgi:IS1 family transposase